MCVILGPEAESFFDSGLRIIIKIFLCIMCVAIEAGRSDWKIWEMRKIWNWLWVELNGSDEENKRKKGRKYEKIKQHDNSLKNC